NKPKIINQEESSPPFVLTSDQQCEVKQNPKEESPSYSDPQTIPFADLCDPLLLQNVDSRSHACLRRDTQFHGARNLPERRVVEYLNPPDETFRRIFEFVLQNPFVRVLHQGEVVEPDPVERDSLSGDEESGEEEEVGEDRYDDGASGPKRGQDREEEEEETTGSAGETNGPECGGCEAGGEEDEGRDRDYGLGEDVGRSPKVVDIANAKNPRRSWAPFGELSSFVNIVAKMIPVTITAPTRIPKSSGCLLEFSIERFPITIISIQKGFAKVWKEDVRFEELFVAPETSFPLEILALDACFARHCLWNSTSVLVPAAEFSSSRIRSSANSVLCSFSGIGRSNSKKN
ncbi:unnamed protein product, partial [Thlaspi arvense]